MRYNQQLSDALHLMLHLAQHDAPLTSEALALARQTHPVVIRRLMAGLKARGYVLSQRGHGGGWTLSCDLADVTLHDLYTALGSPPLLAIGSRDASPSGCLVEAAIDAALNQTLREAEALLLARFGALTLAALRDDVRARVAQRDHPQTAPPTSGDSA